jgi:hypothetical protein
VRHHGDAGQGSRSLLWPAGRENPRAFNGSAASRWTGRRGLTGRRRGRGLERGRAESGVGQARPHRHGWRRWGRWGTVGTLVASPSW